MLILTRKLGQVLTIRPVWQLDPATPIEHLFVEGAIRIAVTGVRGSQVRVGIAAHPAFHILRDELLPVPKAGLLPEDTREVLAQKLKVVMLIRRLGSERLAQLSGLSLTAVMAAESGTGAVYLEDVEKIAQVLKVSVAELFRNVGTTADERMIMALLEEGG